MTVNVALYGGSFDPPHIGHVMVPAHLLLNDPWVDKIIIMPCFEQVGKQLSDFWTRYMMCEQAFGWLPRTEISRLEADMGGESLTVRTVRELKKLNPDWTIKFIIGSDLMTKAPTWEGWDDLLLEAEPLIVGRAGITPPVGTSGPTPIAPAISSTIVRNALENRDYKTAERYVPNGVLSIIQRFQLYTK